jgi:prevent-host-death family protein
MLDLESDIDSLTSFKRATAGFLERLRASGQPLVLTVNGRAQVVVQDAAAYQRLAAAAAKAEREEVIAAVRKGLADVRAGRTQPARPALAKLAKKYGISTPQRKR